MTNAPINDELFERIVQEVIRRLLERGVEVQSKDASPNEELVVEDRVVTLETLRNRLTDIRRLKVAAKAIVTPAVKDELKDRGIELVRTA